MFFKESNESLENESEDPRFDLVTREEFINIF